MQMQNILMGFLPLPAQVPASAEGQGNWSPEAAIFASKDYRA